MMRGEPWALPLSLHSLETGASESLVTQLTQGMRLPLPADLPESLTPGALSGHVRKDPWVPHTLDEGPETT